MARHKHADLIIAWAEGAEIEVQISTDTWILIPNPMWYEYKEYRLKPKQPEWYKDIPPYGVLCRVWNDEDDYKVITLVYSWLYDLPEPFGGDWDRWRHATPLTDDEIRMFLRGEK
mgnify:CR=1 FL=1